MIGNYALKNNSSGTAIIRETNLESKLGNVPQASTILNEGTMTITGNNVRDTGGNYAIKSDSRTIHNKKGKITLCDVYVVSFEGVGIWMDSGGR